MRVLYDRLASQPHIYARYHVSAPNQCRLEKAQPSAIQEFCMVRVVSNACSPLCTDNMTSELQCLLLIFFAYSTEQFTGALMSMSISNFGFFMVSRRTYHGIVRAMNDPNRWHVLYFIKQCHEVQSMISSSTHQTR